MKVSWATAAFLLTSIPTAALADTRTYTAIYSPTLDIETRSCTITSTGIQGDAIRAELGGSLNSLTNSSNTSIMRTIGSGTNGSNAVSQAGIRFDMIGANVLSIEDVEMKSESGEQPNYNGSVKLTTDRIAKVNVSNNVERSLGITSPRSTGNKRLIAHVKIDGGVAQEGDRGENGSVVIGNLNNVKGNNLSLNALQEEGSSGSHIGEVKFELQNVRDINETVAIRATISCEPIPIAREQTDDGATLRPIR